MIRWLMLSLALAAGYALPTPERTAPSDLTERYDPLIAHHAARTGLHPRFVKAVIATESDFDRLAFSPAGAVGLMQLMPKTASLLGVHRIELTDPDSNIRAGTTFLKDLYRTARRHYGLKERRLSRAPVWIQRRVLAGYHAGPRMMFRDKWPSSTVAYVGKVMRTTKTSRSALRISTPS